MSRTPDPRWRMTRTRLSEVRRSCSELLHRFAVDSADHEAPATATAMDETDEGPGDAVSRAPVGQGVLVDFVPRSRVLQDVEVAA